MNPRQTPRRTEWLRPIAALIAMLLAWPVIAAKTPAAPPSNSPSRLLPARGLTFYLEFDGLDAHADAWRATAAREILEKTPAGNLLADIIEVMLAITPTGPQEVRMTAADYIAFGKTLLQKGFAVAWYDENTESPCVLVLNGFGAQEIRARFDRLVRSLLLTAEVAKLPEPIRHRGRDIHQEHSGDGAASKPGDLAPATMTWWFEGDSLVVVPGSAEFLGGTAPPSRLAQEAARAATVRARRVLGTIDGKEPNASTHAGYAAAVAEGKDLKGFEPAGLLVAESRNPLGTGVLSSLREMAAALPGANNAEDDEFSLLESLDINRAKRIVTRWGFRGKSLVTDTRFEAPAPWGGYSGLLDPKGFAKDRLLPIPREMGVFTVGAFVRGDLRAANSSLGATINAKYRDGFRILDEAFRNATTLQLREDLFRHLGPTACLFAAPSGPSDDAGSTVASVLIAIDDAEAVAKALDALANRINAYFSELKPGDGAGGARPPEESRPALALERLPAPERGYRLTCPGGLIPWLTGEIQPTILLGKSFVAIANNPVLARQAIAAESQPAQRWVPTGELMKTFDSLPANVAFLCVGNPRDSFWPDAFADLPTTVAQFLGDPGDNDSAQVGRTLRSLKAPRADAIQSQLHSSVLAVTIDERSLRFITFEALPFGCMRTETKNGFAGLTRSINYEFKFAPRR